MGPKWGLWGNGGVLCVVPLMGPKWGPLGNVCEGATEMRQRYKWDERDMRQRCDGDATEMRETWLCLCSVSVLSLFLTLPLSLTPILWKVLFGSSCVLCLREKGNTWENPLHLTREPVKDQSSEASATSVYFCLCPSLCSLASVCARLSLYVYLCPSVSICLCPSLLFLFSFQQIQDAILRGGRDYLLFLFSFQKIHDSIFRGGRDYWKLG